MATVIEDDDNYIDDEDYKDTMVSMFEPKKLPSHLVGVDLLSVVPSAMHYNPELCIHAVVDKESRGYNICSVWKEQGFLSDIEPIYDLKQWQQSQKYGVNVSVIPFKDTDIQLNELNDQDIPNNFLFNMKNRILEYVYDDDKRASILSEFGGLSFKAESLKLIRSRKEIKPLIKQLHSTANNLRLIAIFIEFKWDQDKYRISIKPRRDNKPQEKSIMICLFVYNSIETNVFDGLTMKSCLLTQRSSWIHGMYQKWPYHQIHHHFLYLSQFWLHSVATEIAPYWSAHYCDDKNIELIPIIIPAEFIPYFYQKRFRMYTNKGDRYTYWYHRKHYVRREEIHPQKVVVYSVDFEDENEEEVPCKLFGDGNDPQNSETEFIDVGIESYDGIFNENDVKCIMHDIGEYIQNTKQPHFALEYKLRETEKKIIKQQSKDITMYTHEAKTYELWKEDNDSLSSEDEYDLYDDEDEKTAAYYCLRYYNFRNEDKQQFSLYGDNKENAGLILDQVDHISGAIPIPEHFRQPLLPTYQLDKDMNELRPIYDFEAPISLGIVKKASTTIPKSIKYGTKEYYEEILKLYVYKYNKIKRKMRDRDKIKKLMSDLNAMYLRSYIHKYPSKVNNINISNDVPIFWRNKIKPRLLKYGLDKIATYFQFAFVFECAAIYNYIKIPLFLMKCGQHNVHFQNAELCLMVFCSDSVTMYVQDISLIVIPGRMYTFNSDTLQCDYIKIFNHKNMKIDIVILRNTPCIGRDNQDDEGEETDEEYEEYPWIDINHYNEHLSLIQMDEYGEFYTVTEDEDEDEDKKEEDEDEDTETESEIQIKNEFEFDIDNVYIPPIQIKKEEIYTENKNNQRNDEDIKGLISQSTLKFEEYGIKRDLEANKGKELINKALEIQDLTELRKYLERLIKEIPHFTDEIQFYIGNSYERDNNEGVAIEWYNKALQTNIKSRGYYKSLTIHHIYECMENTKGSQGIDDDLVKLMVMQWHHAVSNDDKSVLIRQDWIRHQEVDFELIGAARCCMNLARYFQDKFELNGKSRWNDVCLLWYKRSLNILEKLKVIIIEEVPIDEIIHTLKCSEEQTFWILNYNVCNNNKNNEKKGERVLRKRLNRECTDGSYVMNAIDVTQNYLQCIIERFRKEQYTTDTKNDISQYPSFAKFHRLKEELYSSDFELFMEYELDSLFEMNHYYFKNKISSINNGRESSEIADVYINYASYLTDVWKKHDVALLLYQHSLQYNEDPTAYWNIADIYEEMRYYDEAVHYLDLVIQYTPKQSDQYEETLNEIAKAKKCIKEKKKQWIKTRI